MIRYNLGIDDDDYQRVKDIAATEDRSIGWVLRKLISEALQKRKEAK